MKLTFTGFSLLAALTAFACGSWSCSEKKSDADAEISLGTPTPIGSPLAAAVTPNATTVLSFAMPSPTVTPEPMEFEVEDIQGTALALLDGESDPQTIEEGETLETGDSLITKSGSEATLSLNDITAVHVSESTTVKIADLEPNTSQGFVSRLELTAGKVLSEVEELDKSNSTFEVESNGVICGVRGTAFEVENQDGQVETNTFHGAVEVTGGEHSELVNSGEHSDFSFSKRVFLAERKLTASENKRYTAWGKIYKRERQKRAQRMEWLRTRPQTPEAQKFLQCREKWRQKRFQFHQTHPAGPKAFESQIHPKPPALKERQEKRRENRTQHAARPRAAQKGQGHQGIHPHPNQQKRHPGMRPKTLNHPAHQKPQVVQHRPNLGKNLGKPRPTPEPNPLPGKKIEKKKDKHQT